MGNMEVIDIPVKSICVGDVVLIDSKCHLVLETTHGTLGDAEYVDLTLGLEVTSEGLVHKGRRFDPQAIVAAVKRKPVERKWWHFWK